MARRLSKNEYVFPSKVAPMLATICREPFDNKDWLYEIKWDGYRIVSYIKDGEVTLRTRNFLDYSSKYTAVVEELKEIKHNAVIDGEVVAIGEDGKPKFNALQNYDGQYPLVYYCFDLLWLDGKDLTDLPLIERKKKLEEILGDIESDTILYSDHFEAGTRLFNVVNNLGLEGIMAKERNSTYAAGQRSPKWLKIPIENQQEFVIGGWEDSEKARAFRSLLIGYFDGDNFIYVTRTAGGFKEKEMPAILAKLKKLEVKEKPFVNEVDNDKKVHWVKPELVANIKFATWTESGNIRKPAIFQGFRDDKNATDVTKQPTPILQESAAIVQEPAVKKTKKIPFTAGSNWKIIEKQKITSRVDFNADGKKITLTNLDKQIWKGVTKGDLVAYYEKIAPCMLSHVKDRPLSLHIKPNGVNKEGVYIKDMEGRQPDWAQVFSVNRKHKKEDRRDVIDYLVGNDIATLLYTINLGAIDVNPWTAKTDHPEEPDYIVIDLDPSDNDFNKVITTSLAAKAVFDKHKLKTFIKTSGKTGMHILIPCEGFSYPQARAIAETLCSEIHDLVPGITTTTVSVSSRGNKLYIDPSQNDMADTVAAPYSVRPAHQPYVSTPLSWTEVKPGLDFKKFTMVAVLQRTAKKGDLFKQLYSKTTKKLNSKILAKLTSKQSKIHAA